ncbi:MAG: HAMP domain-containing histidine kinase, partial [Anaerolineae bacterium]|nr:HAMP domain-containing histidine kinase [Anaerolineae bacterium]
LKERFISVVSHEFRTPLSVIMSSAELLDRYHHKMPPERQIEHVREVLSQSEYMVGLLEDVLTVNKARAGRLEFNPAPLDVTAFCQGTLERFQGVDKGQHHFVFTHEGDLSGAVLDAKLLQHILVNLLSNAVKYSPDSSEVSLQLFRQNGHVVFRVRDQGIGIPADSLPQLYDPFYRAHNTGDIRGTGLGMTIVKESVDIHGGSIACESQEGVGTTFTVHVPIAPSS